MITHNVKIKPEYINAIIDGKKTFEIRKNDRGYRLGDRVRMSDGERYLIVLIKYISDYEQKENYIVFAFDWIQGGLEDIRKQQEDAPAQGAESQFRGGVTC
ncbi:DUF3850 domain-containing protein [Vibrio kanaloae]|jgi:hypothetical protein|uniref:DUF3850 domain-containing protein n=1 Tax=Vibrio kanaloae TaxID=170673 RepID=A0A4U1ZAQ1_9VIBR|nr:DUF3850 domain-containing protein [Vibrio kanaloae]TKF31643.1 DUF3850 domain-containing protein [Vibrio kanaloae]